MTRIRSSNSSRRPTAALVHEANSLVAAFEILSGRLSMRSEVKILRDRIENEALLAVKALARRYRSDGDEIAAFVGDEARFAKTQINSPSVTGSVMPASPALARRMASFVDPSVPGHVIEIGPGTGPVTEALIERGIDESRLILVEYSPEFCELLRRRFPRATVVEGDAYALSTTLAGHLEGKAIAVVSSLPLFNKPPAMRSALARDAFGLLVEGGPLIQFTYSVISPVPRKGAGLKSFVSDWVLRNIPPARVWVYTETGIKKENETENIESSFASTSVERGKQDLGVLMHHFKDVPVLEEPITPIQRKMQSGVE